MTLKTAVYTHPSFLRHDTGPGHPERPERLQVLLELFNRMNLPARQAPEADPAYILQAHDAAYLDRLEDALPERGLAYLDGDTVVSPGSYTAALHASIPRPDQDVDDLVVIPGRPPNLQHLPKGCNFSPRCPQVQDDCIDRPPRLEQQAPNHCAACFHPFPRREELLSHG